MSVSVGTPGTHTPKSNKLFSVPCKAPKGTNTKVTLASPICVYPTQAEERAKLGPPGQTARPATPGRSMRTPAVRSPGQTRPNPAKPGDRARPDHPTKPGDRARPPAHIRRSMRTPAVRSAPVARILGKSAKMPARMRGFGRSDLRTALASPLQAVALHLGAAH